MTITFASSGQRAEDIPDMIRYFLRRYGPEAGVTSPSITPEAIAFLQSQSNQQARSRRRKQD